MLLSNDYGGAKGVSRTLRLQCISHKLLHKTTIIRTAKSEAGRRGFKIRALTGKPKKMLSATTKLKRYKFCLDHRKRSWKNVMFTDRKKFAFAYPGTKVYPVTWAIHDQRREAPSVNHAAVVNVYAGVTRYGMTKLHVVAGTTGHKHSYKNKKGQGARNITAMEYEDVVLKTLLPEGCRLFKARGISSWVLQQDNDPTHRSAAALVRDYNQKHQCNVSVMSGWPPSSPDLSLIENVWAYLQAKMDARGCKSFTEFKAALEIEAKSISVTYTSRLFAGMQKRIDACISTEGNLTKH